MHPASRTNTNHDIADLINHEMVKNTKTSKSFERKITFLQNNFVFNLSLRLHILRNYCFAVEVTGGNYF